MESFKYIERKILRVDVKEIDQEQAEFAPAYAKYDTKKYKGVGTADVYLHTNLGTEIVTCAFVKLRTTDSQTERFFVMSANKNFACEVTSQIATIPAPKSKPLPTLSITNIGMSVQEAQRYENEMVEDLPPRPRPTIKVFKPSPDFLVRHGK